jgi:hypothetical protein
VNLFRRPHKARTDETVAAVQAVRRIAEALHDGEPVPESAARTVDRVLAPPIAWEDLLRPRARQKGCVVPCRR